MNNRKQNRVNRKRVIDNRPIEERMPDFTEYPYAYGRIFKGFLPEHRISNLFDKVEQYVTDTSKD